MDTVLASHNTTIAREAHPVVVIDEDPGRLPAVIRVLAYHIRSGWSSLLSPSVYGCNHRCRKYPQTLECSTGALYFTWLGGRLYLFTDVSDIVVDQFLVARTNRAYLGSGWTVCPDMRPAPDADRSASRPRCLFKNAAPQAEEHAAYFSTSRDEVYSFISVECKSVYMERSTST